MNNNKKSHLENLENRVEALSNNLDKKTSELYANNIKTTKEIEDLRCASRGDVIDTTRPAGEPDSITSSLCYNKQVVEKMIKDESLLEHKEYLESLQRRTEEEERESSEYHSIGKELTELKQAFIAVRYKLEKEEDETQSSEKENSSNSDDGESSSDDGGVPVNNSDDGESSSDDGGIPVNASGKVESGMDSKSPVTGENKYFQFLSFLSEIPDLINLFFF